MNTNQLRPEDCRRRGCLYILSSPTESSRSIQKGQMGLGNVILVQGRELKQRTLLKRGPWGKGFRKFHPVAKKHRKPIFMQRPGTEKKPGRVKKK